ncbi:protein PAT1 homolog 1, partial [Rhipicephalus sanguineus]|uniref:protein PAT1 homolog 1 n=1 Tax=Rhipicephalus sanguineus TaxID=34632 RepID=UPI0020C59CFA
MKAQSLEERLRHAGHRVQLLSGAQAQSERIKALVCLKAYRCRILVSTDLNSVSLGSAARQEMDDGNGKRKRKTITIQFERSLGKLQVVSVNYPRKILDMGVQRLSEDEDRKVPPDRHLLWFRQLLLDIEKLYSAVLEYEDSSCSAERRLEISEKLFAEVQPSEERFIQVVGVRKGRSLVLRVLPKLKAEHQVATLAALLRHLSWLQRKDRHDGTLERGLLSAVAVIEHASLNDLIQLAASLLMNPDAAFPSRFALRVAWAIVVQAEQHFQREEGGQTFSSEVHKK